ncbi:FlgK family flagellar hook-associated protein, partial [Arthrobacter sp. Hiyo1]|uniref:FlgK family flagellar hook-associated protein n=1 Tax=Arthrobacter sp. Hiyo1 TaxID=1588020 RepID=UPI000A80603B
SGAAQAGYAGYRSTQLQQLEGSLNEPGPAGISTALQTFWSSWQGVSNHPGEAAPAGVLLQAGTTVANAVSAGYKALDSQWTRIRGEAQSTVATLNDAAAQVAGFNATIRSVTASGGSANEIIDARNKVTETIASLADGTVRDNADGTVDVFVGGNAIVSGTSHRELALSGQTSMGALGSAVQSGGPVQLEWADRPGVAVPLDGGKLAGAVSLLAPAAGGAGGAISEAAASYNAFATKLMNDVNAVHRTGQSTTGASNLDFFATTPGAPAACPSALSRRAPRESPPALQVPVPLTAKSRTQSPKSAPGRVPLTRCGPESSQGSARRHSRHSSTSSSPTRRALPPSGSVPPVRPSASTRRTSAS